MAHTYEELSKMTVAQLREIAKGLDDSSLRGYTQLNKAHLLPAVCKALGVETHEHHEAHQRPVSFRTLFHSTSKPSSEMMDMDPTM